MLRHADGVHHRRWLSGKPPPVHTSGGVGGSVGLAPRTPTGLGTSEASRRPGVGEVHGWLDVIWRRHRALQRAQARALEYLWPFS